MAKRKISTDVFFLKNADGVSIKMCCASCEHKDYGDSVKHRRCLFSGATVRPRDLCGYWEMSGFWKKFRATGEGELRIVKRVTSLAGEDMMRRIYGEYDEEYEDE